MRRPRFSIATVSLGKHAALEDKLLAASKAGYDGIEIFDEDFETYAREFKNDHDAAFRLRKVCDEFNLSIECYQPFRAYEGSLDRSKHANDLVRAKHLFEIMQILKTDLLLVCSNVSTDAGTDLIIEDMIELCVLASRYNIRIGYEALAWGTHINKWNQAFHVVQCVDMPNCGLIVDSFNQLGREFADPTRLDGKAPNADVVTKQSLDDLAAIPGHKIFLYQVADAERMNPPLDPADIPHQPVRMTWSRGHRLFPEEFCLGAYLPVAEFTKAVLSTGYAGPLSLEVFNNSLHVNEPNVPIEHAQRGIQGLERLVARCLQDDYTSETRNGPFQAKF